MSDNPLFHRCLLIEDDAAHALLEKRALKDLCSEVVHCTSLADARAALEQSKVPAQPNLSSQPGPDLIITDLNLPDASRVQVVARLMELVPKTPIIVLTSSTSLEDAVRAMKLGAQDFLVKNFDSTFRDILQLALSRIYTAKLLSSERGRLRREMEALRSAIESSNDGLAVCQGSGQVVYANSSFIAFVRKCAGRADNARELIGPKVEHADGLRAALIEKLDNLAQGTVWHTEVRYVEDRSLAYDLSLSAIHRPGSLNEQREWVLWVRDITEEKRRERFQREILSTTTHDLKGPLGAIQISAELLEPLVPAEGKPGEIVKRIASSAQSALNLIEEFLSARRIKEGNFILKPAAHQVAPIVSQVISEFEATAAVKKIALSFENADSELAWSFDRMGLARVLSNLLSNAIKFTQREGQVQISFQVRDGDLHLRVTDTGVGLEPSEVKRIFERFTRLDKHADVPGSGIGLFVVKSIVEAHGGRIEVTSKPGSGTTFDVVLPEQPPVNERGELISLDFT